MQYSGMAMVDPDDDALMRYVIWHYRFDAARRERRNIVVAAHDNESEYMRELQRLHAELQLRQAAGHAEVVEQISGTVKPLGHTAEQRHRRSECPVRGPKARVRKRR